MGRKLIYAAIAAAALTTATFSCSKSSDTASVTASSYLYLSTGLCYAGVGFTPPLVTDVGVTLSRLNLSTSNYEIVKDYGDLADEVTDTFASGIIDGNDGYIYASVENATATGNRRVDKIQKAAFGTRTTWYQNSSILNTPVKGIARAADSGILLGGTTKVERFDSTPTRKLATTVLAWGESHLGLCATNNTNITALVALPAYTGTSYGKYIYAHATPTQNDIGIIDMNGSSAVGSCLANAAGASPLTNATSAISSFSATLGANATPTAIVYIATPTGTTTGKLLVSYSAYGVNSAGTLNNALVLYDINETGAAAAAISNGQILYNDHNYFFGVTAMAYDSSTGLLYVSTSNDISKLTPVGYNIEKFSINLTTPSATRVTNTDMSSFQSANSLNNCVTGMVIGN